MKKIFILAAICLPLLFCGCEKKIIDTDITIYGTVYDATTFNPIQGVMLTAQPGGRNCYTGSDGAFNFEAFFEPGKYTITATITGYQTDRKSVVMTSGQSTELSFALRKE